jgi:anti-sigma factor RsiW
MANCAHVRQLVSSFQDAELEPPQMQQVAYHLVACPDCGGILKDYTDIAAALREATPPPDLEGFTGRVLARVESLRLPLRVRLGRLLDAMVGERLTAWLALGSTAMAVAALTAVLVAPYIYRSIGHEIGRAGSEQASTPTEGQFAAASSRTEISALESHFPSVAVWSVPQTETTVIWVPDQEP